MLTDVRTDLTTECARADAAERELGKIIHDAQTDLMARLTEVSTQASAAAEAAASQTAADLAQLGKRMEAAHQSAAEANTALQQQLTAQQEEGLASVKSELQQAVAECGSVAQSALEDTAQRLSGDVRAVQQGLEAKMAAGDAAIQEVVQKAAEDGAEARAHLQQQVISQIEGQGQKLVELSGRMDRVLADMGGQQEEALEAATNNLRDLGNNLKKEMEQVAAKATQQTDDLRQVSPFPRIRGFAALRPISAPRLQFLY
jgi:hypothetical protein